jgi:hypothetical protein
VPILFFREIIDFAARNPDGAKLDSDTPRGQRVKAKSG